MRILALPTTVDKPEAYLFAGLQQRGCTVHVMGTPIPEHREVLEEAGVRITEFSFKSRFDLSAMRQLRRRVQEESIDIVYALSNRALSCSVIGLAGISTPIVAYRGTVGHISWFDPTSYFTYLNAKVRKILCVSKAVEQYLLSIGIPQHRLTTIYKGHDLTWYSGGTTPSRASVGIPDDAFVIGCTAVMRAVKGVDVLLNAAAQAMNSIPNLHLILIGPIKDREIERQVASFPKPERLHLTGFRADATALARICDATVLASKNREGLAKSVIEAMAQGIPAIVTAVGGMPELIDQGRAGVLIPPNDSSALTSAIEELAHNPQRRLALGKAAQQQISDTFSIQKTIDATYAMFQTLI
jgi:glycosyltransferase involved in cell wall biosynthesis